MALILHPSHALKIVVVAARTVHLATSLVAAKHGISIDFQPAFAAVERLMDFLFDG